MNLTKTFPQQNEIMKWEKEEEDQNERGKKLTGMKIKYNMYPSNRRKHFAQNEDMLVKHREGAQSVCRGVCNALGAITRIQSEGGTAKVMEH